ncbi:hypothetical protein V6N13_089768 [Hibiscus sabdariffa]
MKNNSADNEDEFLFDGDDLTWSQVGRAFGAHDPIYLTRASRNPSSASVKGKDVATSSSTFTLRSTHQALSHHDDEVEEDIGEDGDYRLDGDDFCDDGGDLE